jgi:hypothetical protein
MWESYFCTPCLEARITRLTDVLITEIKNGPHG